jgi:hypothetical protein
MKNLLAAFLLLGVSNVNACALSTYHWPIPSGYKEGTIDFTSIVKRQKSWDGKSELSVSVSAAMKNINNNIEQIIEHHKYINYLPEILKELQFKEFELMSFRVEPLYGNSIEDSDGEHKGSLGYLLPEVYMEIEELQKKWIIVFEYKLVFSWPNDRRHLFHKIDIPTLTDGTILYEYPGMGKCGE